MSKLLSSYELSLKKEIPFKKENRQSYYNSGTNIDEYGLEYSGKSFVEGSDEEEIGFDNYKFSTDWTHPDGELDYEEYSDAFIEKRQTQDMTGLKTAPNHIKKKIKEAEHIDLNDEDYSESDLEDLEDLEKKKKENKMEEIDIENIKTVHWYGNFTSYGGFSRMNRIFAFGLNNRGVVVKADMEECPIEINEHTISELRYMSKNQIPSTAPKVFGATIPLRMNHSGYKILYTMIENSEGLHIDYVDKLNMFSEIWVPTEFGKNLMIKNGVKSPIKIMPLGVDTDRYKEKKVEKDPGLNSFVFLSVFKWHYRKGYDLLLKAYMREFDSQDDVSLLLISRPNYENSNIIYKDFEKIRETINKKDEDLPHIKLIDDCVSEKDLPDIYNSANAYFTMTRGEGFCLPILEAASCGLPVISTFNTAMTDYLRDDDSFLIYPEDMIKAEVTGNMKEMAKMCRFYEDQYFPVYDSKSIKLAQNHLRHVYENEQEAKNKSKKLTEKIRKNYSWEKAVDNVYNGLMEIK